LAHAPMSAPDRRRLPRVVSLPCPPGWSSNLVPQGPTAHSRPLPPMTRICSFRAAA